MSSTCWTRPMHLSKTVPVTSKRNFENANTENKVVNEKREKEGKEEEEEYKEDNFEEEREGSDRGGNAQKWKISKFVGGTTFIHIKNALKLILSREYIARCHQKRHWAAKYLLGKAPLDPKHGIIKLSNVALKGAMQRRRRCIKLPVEW